MPQPGTQQQPLDTNEHALGAAEEGDGVFGHPFWYMAGCPNPKAFAWPQETGNSENN